MNVTAEHERRFVQAFVASDRQNRYLGLLATPEGRTKFTEALHHDLRLDPRYAIRLSAGQTRNERIKAVIAALGNAGSESCILISANSRLDGQRLPLPEALAEVVGYGGTIISCVAGEVAYYEGEETGERYVCRRHSAV